MPFTVIIANSITELQAVLAAVGGVTSNVTSVVATAMPAAAAAQPVAAAPARRVGRPRKTEAAPAAVVTSADEVKAESVEVADPAAEEVDSTPAVEAKAAPEQRKSRTRNPHPNPFLWGGNIIDNRNNVLLLEALLAVAPGGNGAEKVFRLNKITTDIENASAKSLFYADTKRLIELGIVVRIDAGREFVVKLTKGARAKLVREAQGAAEVTAEASALEDSGVEASVNEADIITADRALDGAEA